MCRLHFNGNKKYIGIFDSDKKELRNQIDKLEDIYQFENELLQTVDYYEN